MADACATVSSTPVAVAGVAPTTVPLTHVSSIPSPTTFCYSADLLKACEPFVIRRGDADADADADSDSDAKLKREDMAKAVKALGWKSMSDEEIDRIVSSLSVSDSDEGSGLVKLVKFVEEFGKSEYVAAVARLESTEEGSNEILEAFRVFDKNGDGKISKDELRQALVVLGVNAKEDEIDDLMKQADLNCDGSVCYGEFVKLLNAPM